MQDPLAASDDQQLEALKSDIWAGFKGMVMEVKEKYDTFDQSTDFKEFVKPFGEKHGASIGEKIRDFKQKHPTTDVGPQALITLSTEQMQEAKTSMGATGSWLCTMARGPVI